MEAVVDMRVAFSEKVDSSKLAIVHDKISDRYPKKQIKRRFESKIQIKEGVFLEASREDKGILGYSFLTDDEKQIVQFRLDGFTVNRLKPYETWENLRDEARRLWTIYAETVLPDSIERLALRYINRLELPPPTRDFGEYLTSPPILPDSLPQELNHFLTRLVVHEKNLDVTTIIIQSIEGLQKPEILPIILDIDTFKEVHLEVNSPEIWSTFEKLHDFKNKIFFELITEKTMEAFL